MAEAVPGERRDAVAEPDPFAIEPLGDPDGPISDLAVVGAVHRAFDHPRGDLPVGELDRREIDDLVHQQGPFLHASQHSILPIQAALTLDRGERICSCPYLAPGALLGNRAVWISPAPASGPQSTWNLYNET